MLFTKFVGLKFLWQGEKLVFLEFLQKQKEFAISTDDFYVDYFLDSFVIEIGKNKNTFWKLSRAKFWKKHGIKSCFSAKNADSEMDFLSS